MIVYVETNFLLELAYLQETHQACRDILNLAHSGSLTLVIPAFSITEARMAARRQAKQRTEFQDKLIVQVRELSRSKPEAGLHDSSRELIGAFVRNSEESLARLDAVIEELYHSARIEPSLAETTRFAIEAERTLGLSTQDALVYASILQHLRSDSSALKCFLTRNSKDFANPDIYDELGRANCKLLTDFQDGLNYIRSVIGQA